MTLHHHMRQLDALRFFAVVSVLFAHFWRLDPRIWILGRLPWGELGVRLFFVLSGFLITGILLQGRRMDGGSLQRRLAFLRRFYIRRFLRIFPIYYLVVGIACLFGIGPARQIWPWLVSYTTNIYIWYHQDWIGRLGHLWTLAVEEQFYLAWPWLLLFLSRRWLLMVLLLLVSIAPVYRLLATYAYPDDMVRGGYTSLALTAAVVDSLAAGALLAIWTREPGQSERLRAWLGWYVMPVGIMAYAVLLSLADHGGVWHATVALAQTAETLIFCWVIDRASRGVGGHIGRVLEWRPLLYLGKISYGIYLFHFFVPPAISGVVARAGLSYPQRGPLNFLVASLVTIAIASLSWRFVEGPINGMKRHFSYETEQEARALSRPNLDPRLTPARGGG